MFNGSGSIFTERLLLKQREVYANLTWMNVPFFPQNVNRVEYAGLFGRFWCGSHFTGSRRQRGRVRAYHRSFAVTSRRTDPTYAFVTKVSVVKAHSRE